MQSKGGDYVSLDTFTDQYAKNSGHSILNSPRSLEACRRVGVIPDDLLIRDMEEMKQIFPDKLHDTKYLQAKLAFYEDKRRSKVILAKEERVKVKEEEKQGLIIFDPVTGVPTYIDLGGVGKNGSKGQNSSLIEREKKQLEKIRFRQVKIIVLLHTYLRFDMKLLFVACNAVKRSRIDDGS